MFSSSAPPPRRNGSLLHTLNAVSSRELSAARSPAQLCAGDAEVATVNPGELTELSCPPCPLPKDDLTSQEPNPHWPGSKGVCSRTHDTLCCSRVHHLLFGLLRLWSSLRAGWQHCLGYCRPLIGKQQRLVCLFVVGLLVVAARQPVCFASRLDHTAKTKQNKKKNCHAARNWYLLLFLVKSAVVESQTGVRATLFLANL